MFRCGTQLRRSQPPHAARDWAVVADQSPRLALAPLRKIEIQSGEIHAPIRARSPGSKFITNGPLCAVQIFRRSGEVSLKRGSDCLGNRPIHAADMDLDNGHDLRIARVFWEIERLGVQRADSPERSSGAALTRVFIQGTIHRAVNSEPTTAADNERTITESLVRPQNPAYSEREFHTGGECNPHVSCRFVFDICDRRRVASAKTRGNLRCGDSH